MPVQDVQKESDPEQVWQLLVQGSHCVLAVFLR